MMIRWRGSLEQTIHDIARRRASVLPTRRIIAEIRATAGSRRHTIGVSYLETLTDILVHGQDIAIPLGYSLTMPPRAAAVAASRVLSMRWPPPLPAAGQVAGFRLTATDTSWSAGEGPEVRGPVGALLLVCAGRLAALPQLAGPGAPALAARLGGPQPASAGSGPRPGRPQLSPGRPAHPERRTRCLPGQRAPPRGMPPAPRPHAGLPG